MTRPAFLTAHRSLICLLPAMLLAGFVPARSTAQAPKPSSKEDFRYLLVRRAGSPEKNYYDLSRTAHFFEPQHLSSEIFSQYKPSPRNSGFDIVTEHSVRYGVYQALKIRVITPSDSEKAPSSAKDGVYVLIYARQPDWIFCARRYSVVSAKDGGRKITYTDFLDGREYTMELTLNWPRPWQIYELEVLSSNALGDIWQTSRSMDGH